MEFLPLILPFLDKFLTMCLDKVSSESPQEYLADHYNALTGKMDSGIVRDAMPQTRRAALKARQGATKEQRKNWPRYSKEEIYAITEKRLIEAATATPEQMSAAMSACASIQISED